MRSILTVLSSLYASKNLWQLGKRSSFLLGMRMGCLQHSCKGGQAELPVLPVPPPQHEHCAHPASQLSAGMFYQWFPPPLDRVTQPMYTQAEELLSLPLHSQMLLFCLLHRNGHLIFFHQPLAMSHPPSHCPAARSGVS